MKVKIIGTLILLLDLYLDVASSVTSRKEHSLRAFENGVLRKIFRPKRRKYEGGKC